MRDQVREEIAKAIRDLGYKEGTFVHAEPVPGNPVRWKVELNGEYFGTWDLEEHTFVD